MYHTAAQSMEKKKSGLLRRFLEHPLKWGPRVREFEDKVAATFDKQHGIMVNSGSSALYLAVEVLDLPKGSEVITPALTFATTVGCLVKKWFGPSIRRCRGRHILY